MQGRSGVEEFCPVELHVQKVIDPKEHKLVVARVCQLVVNKGHQTATPTLSGRDIKRFVIVPSQQPVLAWVEAFHGTINCRFTAKLMNITTRQCEQSSIACVHQICKHFHSPVSHLQNQQTEKKHATNQSVAVETRAP